MEKWISKNNIKIIKFYKIYFCSRLITYIFVGFIVAQYRDFLLGGGKWALHSFCLCLTVIGYIIIYEQLQQIYHRKPSRSIYTRFSF